MSIYKEYADTKSAIKALEAIENELKGAIIEDLHKQKLDKIEGDYGKFIIANRKKWTYSKKLVKAEEGIKIDKLDEQENGKAKVETSEYLIYKDND